MHNLSFYTYSSFYYFGNEPKPELRVR